MQTEDGLKSTLTQQVSKALLQSKIVDRDIDNIREAQILSLFNISSIYKLNMNGCFYLYVRPFNMCLGKCKHI